MVWKMKVRKEHIFQGKIKHFSNKPEGIHVDWFDFRDMKNLYFLSHAHSDHFTFEDNPNYIGLLSKNFIKKLQEGPHIKIYCTTTTWEIIIRLPKAKAHAEELGKLKEKNFVLVEPDIVKSITIELLDKKKEKSGQTIDVTVIPANHIPGAVMFLFENGEKRALYTGDFRYDVRENNIEMRDLEIFVKNLEANARIIDYLYVDVQCLDLGRLYHPDQNKLPTRQDSKDMVCDLISRENPKSVHIDAEMVGAEDMVKAVAESFNNTADGIISRLDEGCSRKELYEYTLQGIKKTIDPEVHIHIHDKSIFKAGCRKCDEDKDTLKIRATLFWLIYINKYSYSKPDTWKNNCTIKDNDNFWQILYSHHSSDYELRKFISHLKFKEVFPINEPLARENWKEITYEKLEYVSDQAGTRVKKRLSNIRKSLYVSLDCPSMKSKDLFEVIWFKLAQQFVPDLPFYDEKFTVHIRKFLDSSGIFPAVRYKKESVHFLVIPCTEELFDRINQFIGILRKILEGRVTAVLFYSVVNRSNDPWKPKIDQIRSDTDKVQVFYIDLSKVPQYTGSNDRRNLEARIIFETLKNLIRNEDKEVFVSDWPMPYEFSERKREYDQENQDRVKEPESQEVEMVDTEEVNNNFGEAEETAFQKDEPLSQEIEMTEPQK